MTVVGVALAGGPGGGEAVPAASSAPVARASAAAPVVGAVSSIDRLSSVVFVASPATTDQVLTTAEVVVRGDVRMSITRIQVLLQSTSAEPIVVRTVGPMSLDWHRDGPRRIPFVVAMPLPDPRPSGPAVVQIVAYDSEGRVRGVFVRRIQIGARVDPAYGDGPRPKTGEDGLMGGITFGSNFGWRSDGR